MFDIKLDVYKYNSESTIVCCALLAIISSVALRSRYITQSQLILISQYTCYEPSIFSARLTVKMRAIYCMFFLFIRRVSVLEIANCFLYPSNSFMSFPPSENATGTEKHNNKT